MPNHADKYCIEIASKYIKTFLSKKGLSKGEIKIIYYLIDKYGLYDKLSNYATEITDKIMNCLETYNTKDLTLKAEELLKSLKEEKKALIEVLPTQKLNTSDLCSLGILYMIKQYSHFLDTETVKGLLYEYDALYPLPTEPDSISSFFHYLNDQMHEYNLKYMPHIIPLKGLTTASLKKIKLKCGESSVAESRIKLIEANEKRLANYLSPLPADANLQDIVQMQMPNKKTPTYVWKCPGVEKTFKDILHTFKLFENIEQVDLLLLSKDSMHLFLYEDTYDPVSHGGYSPYASDRQIEESMKTSYCVLTLGCKGYTDSIYADEIVERSSLYLTII